MSECFENLTRVAGFCDGSATALLLPYRFLTRPYQALLNKLANAVYEKTNEKLGFYKESPSRCGTEWYDSLPVLDSLKILVNGREFSYENLDCDRQSNQPQLSVASDISIRIECAGKSYEADIGLLIKGRRAISSYEAFLTSQRLLSNTLIINRRSLKNSASIHKLVRDLTDELFESACTGYDDAYDAESEFFMECVDWLLRKFNMRDAADRILLETLAGDAPNLKLLDRSLCWTLRYDGRLERNKHEPTVEIVSLQRSSREDYNHQMLVVCHNKSDLFYAQELVSSDEITDKVVEAYLEKRHGFKMSNEYWKLTPVSRAEQLNQST